MVSRAAGHFNRHLKGDAMKFLRLPQALRLVFVWSGPRPLLVAVISGVYVRVCAGPFEICPLGI
jgi:hypothetical protein